MPNPVLTDLHVLAHLFIFKPTLIVEETGTDRGSNVLKLSQLGMFRRNL